MRISEVAAATGVSVPTLKFYLREGVLHAGVSRSRTQADYDDSHVDRVRLVRALVEVGGLDLATVGRVLEVIDRPDVARRDGQVSGYAVFRRESKWEDGKPAGEVVVPDGPEPPTEAGPAPAGHPEPGPEDPARPPEPRRGGDDLDTGLAFEGEDADPGEPEPGTRKKKRKKQGTQEPKTVTF